MSQGGRLLGQVEEVPDENIDEDMEVVCVKVFVGARGGEDEIEELEREQLEGGFGCRPVRLSSTTSNGEPYLLD